MKLDSFIVSIVLVAVFISAGFFVVADLNHTYSADGVNISNADFDVLESQAEDHLNTSYDISKDMQDKAFGEEITVLDAISSVVKGSFSAVRQVANTFGMLFSMVGTVADALGVPSFFVTALITIVVVLVIFAVIMLFMRAAV